MYRRNIDPYSTIDYKTSDHIYYNIVIPNNNPKSDYSPIQATFTENRTTPLIDTPSDWYMSVIRFYVPGQEIPLTVLPIKPYPNLNPNLTTLSVILSYNNIFSDEIPLIYTPGNTIYLPPPPATVTNPDYQITNYYYIYSYQDVIDIANIAIETALINLKTKPGTAAIAAAVSPLFYYDSVTQLITLSANSVYYDSKNLPTPIKIFGNTPFETFFSGFPTLITTTPVFLQNSLSYQYLIEATGNNTVSGIINYLQEYVTVGLWNIFKSIVFITGTVPIETESIPSIDGSGLTIGRRIMTDFDPLINDTAGQSVSILQYYPQGPYRLTNLLSNVPLFKFDITAYWQDKEQKLYPLYISYNNVLTIKILFVRKTVYIGK